MARNPLYSTNPPVSHYMQCHGVSIDCALSWSWLCRWTLNAHCIIGSVDQIPRQHFERPVVGVRYQPVRLAVVFDKRLIERMQPLVRPRAQFLSPEGCAVPSLHIESLHSALSWSIDMPYSRTPAGIS